MPTFRHPHSGGLTIHVHDEAVDIYVEDAASGVYALEVTVPVNAFLQAVARHGHVECTFWLDGTGRVGAKREVKTERVAFNMYGRHKRPRDTDHDGYRTAATVKALAPYEVDGWTANERDMWNRHNRETDSNGRTYQKVAFVRFTRGGQPLHERVTAAPPCTAEGPTE
jgi:hypothetical protein